MEPVPCGRWINWLLTDQKASESRRIGDLLLGPAQAVGILACPYPARLHRAGLTDLVAGIVQQLPAAACSDNQKVPAAAKVRRALVIGRKGTVPFPSLYEVLHDSPTPESTAGTARVRAADLAARLSAGEEMSIKEAVDEVLGEEGSKKRKRAGKQGLEKKKQKKK